MSPEDTNLELAIQFARHNFDNCQSLIRSSDTKAGVTVTIMVFLAASALQIGKDVVGHVHFQPCPVGLLSAAFIVASVGLLVSVFWSLLAVHRVIRPRGARHTVPIKGREMMWQEHVLLHGSNEEYSSAVRVATPELILRNLTDQVYELAGISKEKMRALENSRWVAWLGFCSWVVLIASGLILARH